MVKFNELKIADVLNFKTEDEKGKLIKGQKEEWIKFFQTPFIERLNMYIESKSIEKDND